MVAYGAALALYAELAGLGLLSCGAARGEDLRTYPEPGGLHVVVGDLVSTVSYTLKVHDGEGTQTITLGGDGEAWAWTADPAPRLLTVTVLRGTERILWATAATGDPALLIDDAATSVALLALAQQRAAVLAKLKGANRTAAEAAFEGAQVDILAVLRAAGREVYFSKAREAKAESAKAAAKLGQKIPKTAAGDRR
jgi:hypothetical protein